MSGYKTIAVDGTMSVTGDTNTRYLRRPQLDPQDQKVICSAICQCKDTPGVGKNGQSLKQMCVSGQLRELDAALMHRSPYKPECNYDMTQDPPAPIMDSSIETKVHDYLPGWIKKYWEVDHGSPYLKGAGDIRRPDVIIVNDPTKPPTQDNIKQVVEIKFPPDKMSPKQEKAYRDIAGSKNKLVETGPDDCGCGEEEQEQTEESKANKPAAELGTAAALAALLRSVLTKIPLRVPVF